MSEIYFTKEHEWVKVCANIAQVGISEHAAHELGDVTFVELPAIGRTFKQNEVIAAVESVKAASDIYAPVSGTVVKVNIELDDAPEKVNAAAEESAWMVEIEMSDATELSGLMNIDQYKSYLETL